MQDKLQLLRNSVSDQFHSRTVVEGKKAGVDFGIKLNTFQLDRELLFQFRSVTETHCISIPIPFMENGVLLIEQNDVRRALCNYWIEKEERELDFFSIMHYIICGDPVGILPSHLVKKIPFIQQVVYSFASGNASTVVYNMQRAINEVTNRMPLHETDMTSWVMNQRLVIIDPDFDALTDPKERLDYQIAKNLKYNGKYGWTSMGLSDGSLADMNYILKYDIRHFTPWGMRFHNPQRNLYSTLAMKGDELPLVRSESMQYMMDQGMTRKGWNLFTMFVDVPDVFEDQIMVDESHKNKKIKYKRRFQCFGRLVVKKGDVLRYKQPLSVAKDGEVKTFDTRADKAWVKDIKFTVSNVGGTAAVVQNVIVEYERKLKDGVKITNMHGNKGVIRLKPLGYAIDPRTGDQRKIDIIVSAKSIQKRKNYGQVLEALYNNLTGEAGGVVEDYKEVTQQEIEDALLEAGFPSDGKWVADTYRGELTGICGTVFWGVTKDVEDQIWDHTDTVRRNGRDLRTAGLKFSTVEFRALTTRFGKNNPVLDEIMAYCQATDDVHEQLTILRGKRGELPTEKPVVNAAYVRPLVQAKGTMVDAHEITGTIVDESFMPDGFVLQLPVTYHVAVDHDGSTVYEGYPQQNIQCAQQWATDKIYVPNSNMRKCWRHESGKWGMSEAGVWVNNIVKLCHRFMLEPEEPINTKLLYMSIYNYYDRVARKMGTKRGEISTYCMAVRYPYSAKAVATLSNALPKNTIQIHRNMARKIKVRDGDVVLVERFPCLGFMSVRPQKVKVTDDPMCKYTIRVSGNSLGSLSLDFDGDVLFIASFHTPQAKEALLKEWTNPNQSCYKVIKELNLKAGKPHTKCMGLQDFGIKMFADLDEDMHAELVKRSTGVKSHTGPVIALAYNIMRIVENSDIKDNQKTNVAVELFLDKVGNSVFKQKHGVKSLHDIVIDAICTADVNMLVEHGFRRGTSTIICDIIRQKAAMLSRPINDLKSYHEKAKQRGWSKVINKIVREQNKIYFASRACLEGCDLLTHLEHPAVDFPSKMFKWTLTGKAQRMRNELEKHFNEGGGKLKTHGMKKACEALCELIDSTMVPEVSGEGRREMLRSRELLKEVFAS